MTLKTTFALAILTLTTSLADAQNQMSSCEPRPHIWTLDDLTVEILDVTQISTLE